MKTKLALVGTAPSLVDTPWDDEELEIWTLAHAIARDDLLRADKVFEMHTQDFYENKDYEGKSAEYFNKIDLPIYMHEHRKDVPKSLKFPRPELKKYFGYEYYGNSICYMLTLALYMKQYKEIYLYGINLADDEEYRAERMVVEHWIGQARGRGVKVIIHPMSEIMTIGGQYGYDDVNPEIVEVKKRIDFAKKGRKESKKEILVCLQNEAYVRGQIEILKEIVATDKPIEDFKQGAKAVLPKYEEALNKHKDGYKMAEAAEQRLIGTEETLTSMRNMMWRRGWN